MNNSFDRLIDGMCATLRTEVLARLDDEFARGQVFGVINLLNTFKVRADWSAGFLLQQLAAQREALDEMRALASASPAAASFPALVVPAVGELPSIDDLLARRDEGNRALGQVLAWLDGAAGSLPAPTNDAIEAVLRRTLRAEVDVELANSPRPLFAEMSSGKEG